MDKPTVGKIATVAKPITREQFDEAYLLMASTANPTSVELLKWCDIIHTYPDQQKAIIDRMTKHIAHTCICCPILGIGTCPRDAEQCPEAVDRYFAEGK